MLSLRKFFKIFAPKETETESHVVRPPCLSIDQYLDLEERINKAKQKRKEAIKKCQDSGTNN